MAEIPFEYQPIPDGLITKLEVNDEVNREDWSVRLVLMKKDKAYGDRDYLIETLPIAYEGAEWIRPACDSKNYTGLVLATFIAGADQEVYVAHDERITNKPSWLNRWTRTNDIIIDNQSSPVRYRLYRKDFIAGSAVSLGKNGQSSGVVNYLVIVKPKVGIP
jgi:pectinesterase